MKHFILFFLFNIFSLNFWGQTFIWLNDSTNNQDEIIKDMTIDLSGNLIQIIWNHPEGSGFNRIRKIDSSGSEIFEHGFYAKLSSIDVDSNGNIFVLGSSAGNIDLNPDPLVRNDFQTGSTSEGLFVVKFSDSGSFINFGVIGDWPACKSTSPTYCTFYPEPKQLLIDYNGDVLFTYEYNGGGFIDLDPTTSGVYYKSHGTYERFQLVKWSNNLDSLHWVKNIKGKSTLVSVSGSGSGTNLLSHRQAVYIDVDSNNNIYCASESFGNITLTKISPSGVTLHPPFFGIGGFSYNYIDAISVVSNKEIIIGGHFIDSIEVNPKITSSPSQLIHSNSNSSRTKAFLVMIDSSFNYKWKKGFLADGTNIIEDIAVNKNTIMVCGLSNQIQPSSSHPSLRWKYSQAYLKIYDKSGLFIKENLHISPYPESHSALGIPMWHAINVQPTSRIFGITKYESVSTIMKRHLNIYKDNIYIGGEINSYQPTIGSPIWPLGFDWNRCDTIPKRIPRTNNIRTYLSKYSLNDSYETLNLSIDACGSFVSATGKTYTSSGLYLDTLIDPTNCNRIYHYNLNITPNVSISTITPIFQVVNTSMPAAQISVNVAGSPLNYQWQINNNGTSGFANLTNSLTYSGVDSNVLSINNISGLIYQNNSFRCIVKNSSNCKDTSRVSNLYFSPNSIADNLNHQNISIYPNPVNNNLTIKSHKKFSKVIIYNSLGEKLKVFDNSSNINVSQLPSGLYFIIILNDNILLDKKYFIKN